nr:rRNA maturation RNase YbeY [Maliibacterium massiliense]
MTIEIDDQQQEMQLPDALLAQVRQAMCAALAAEGCPDNVEASVLFMDDPSIAHLNGEFRGVEAPTDVLSFPMLEQFDYSQAPIDEETGRIYLGDVAISLERASAQAEAFGHSLAREVAYLAVHSALHLVGYDHINEAQREVMRKKEEAALAAIGLVR